MGEKQKRRQKDKGRTVTVRGVVEILEDNGSPIDAVLIADNEEEFYISVPGGDPDPADFVDQYVQVSGVIYEQDGCISIAAKNISLVESMDEYSDFEEREEWFEEDYEEEDLDDFIRSSKRSGGMGFSGDY